MLQTETLNLLRDGLILTILLAEVALLIGVERRRLGSWVTPFSVLAVPYTLVVLLALLFSKPLGFYALYVPSVAVWMIGLLVFWGAGAAVSLPFARAVRANNRAHQPFRFERAAERMAMVLAVVIVPFPLLRLLRLIASSGLAFLASDDFARAFGTGLTAHMMVFCYPLIILLIGTLSRKKPLNVVVLAALFVPVLAYQVKSWFVVPIVAGLLYRWLSGRLRLTLRGALLFVAAMVVFFFASYLIGYGARDTSVLTNPAVYLYLVRHLMNYLWAGVLAFSEFVHQSAHYEVSSASVFAPFVNLYSVLTGLPVISQVNPNFIQIETLGRVSNVYTFFGSLLIFLGWGGLLLYTAVVAVVLHLLYCAALLVRNCWLVVWWALLGAMLAMGWFEFYFWNLSAVETSAYCAMLAFAFWVAHAATPRRTARLSAQVSA